VGRCLNEGPGETEVGVKMRLTRSRTKRPRGALLQLDIGLGLGLCRIGGRQGSWGASLGGAAGEIPPCVSLGSNVCRDPVCGPCQVGSLTGAVASQKVTEARNGSLRLNGNQS
jgi:hypothetical protein